MSKFGGLRHPFSQTHGGPEHYLLVLRSFASLLLYPFAAESGGKVAWSF
jgi:hypothetical protein